MNSSKLSLKEGFNFLFEEKTKKFKITYTKEEVNPRNIEDHIAYILTTDIVTSTINGDNEPLLFRIYNTQKGDAKSDVSFVQGKSISFKLLAKEINKGVEGFKNTFNTSSDNVENIAVIADIYRQYKDSVNAINDVGASRMMLEAKMNVLKISKSRYAMLFRTIKNSNTFLPKQKGQKTINFTKIFGVVSARINDGELLKTKASESGKFEINDNFKDYNDSEKLYLVVYNFFKKLTKDQIDPFGGKTSINNFLQILKNNGDKSTENPKPVEELVKSFRESWAITKSGTLRKKPVSKKLSSAFDEMIAKALETESPEEAQSAIDNAQATIDSISDDFFDELDKTLSRDGDQEDAPEDESAEDKSGGGGDKVASIIKQAQNLLKSFEEEEEKIDAELSKIKKDLTVDVFNKMLKQLTDYANSISISNALLTIIFKHNKDFNKNATRDQKSEVEDIINKLNTKQQKTVDVINKLTNDSKESDSIDNSEIESALTTVAFDPNTVNMIKFEDIFPDLNKDEIVTKAKSEFEDMKTQIGSPGLAADDESDEPPAVPKDKVFVQTTLSTPGENDFNDFVRKYVAIAAFISFISEDAGKKLISDSAQDLKAGQLVNLLKQYAKEVGESNRKVLDDSISNLAKFTYKNVEGILFERVESSKYFVKINKQIFVKSSNLIKLTMENMSPEDAFSNAVLETFFAPKFQLTDSAGNNLFTNIDGARLAFKNANTSKKSIEFVKEKGVDSDLGKIIFKIENRPVMELTSSLNLIITNPVDLPNMQDTFIDFAQLGGTLKSFGTELGLSDKQMQTISSFMSSISDRYKNAISNIIDNENIDEEDKQKLTDIVTSTLAPQGAETQQLDSKKSSVEQKQVVNTVEDLLNHKDVRTMMDKLYLDNSLSNAIDNMNETQILKIRNGTSAGADEINKVKSALITSLNPDLTGIKNEIKNLCSDGTESRNIFDKVFFSKQYDEEAFKAAYGALIMSAFDKIIRGKSSRITEGVLSNAWKFIKASAAQVASLAIPAAILIGGLWMFGLTVPAWVSVALGSWATGKSLYDAAKWKKESENYRDNPIKYITETLDDKDIKKVTKGILNAAAADVVIKAINVQYNSPSAPGQLSAGKSDFSKNIQNMSNEYNKLSDERKSGAKVLNDYVLGEISKSAYYQKGIISESIINSVFNGIMFGSDRVTDACREEILLGQFDLQTSKYKDELIQSLIASIKKSPVKNNFVNFIENHTRKNTGKGRYRFGTDEELKQRNNKNFLGMNKSAFVSNEQITEDYMNELLQDLTGLGFKDFETLGYTDVNNEFKEGIHKKDLIKFLFEDTTQNQLFAKKTADNAKDKIKKGPDYPDLVAACWAGSLVKTIKMKTFMIGGSTIYKDILAWSTSNPNTGGGGLFGFKITAKLPKIINTVYTNPAQAKAAASVGSDGLSYQIKLAGGKIFQGYYWNGKATVGSAKAASGMLIDPATGTAKMIGHGNALFKHAAYFKKLGLLIDTKTGTFSVIKGSSASLIDPNSADYINNLKIIATSLKGSIPGLAKATSVFTAKNTVASIAGNFNPDGQEFIAKTLYKQLTGQSLAGEVPDVDASLGKYVNQLENAMSKAKGIVATDKNTGKQFILKGANAVRASKDSHSALKAYVADVKAASTKLLSAKDQLSWYESSGAVEKQFINDVTTAFTKNIVNHRLIGVKTTLLDIVQTLDNKAAQQGLDVLLPKAVSGGSLGVSKTAGGAAKKTLLSKVKVVQGTTPKDIPVETDSFDYTAMGAKVAPLVGITTKIMAEFVKRGIKGANFAEYFYKVFNPQQVFYADMLNTLLGNQVMSAKTQIVNTAANGAHTGVEEDEIKSFMTGDQNQIQNYSSSDSDQLTMLGNGGFKTGDLEDISSQTTKAESLYLGRKILNEEIVCDVSLTSYLFENRDVTELNYKKSLKSTKKSNLQKELNKHRNLQKMFKNLI